MRNHHQINQKMNTLIKLVMAAVLNIVSPGELPEPTASVAVIKMTESKYTLDQLNPHYIITRDEFLSLEN